MSILYAALLNRHIIYRLNILIYYLYIKHCYYTIIIVLTKHETNIIKEKISAYCFHTDLLNALRF